MTLAVVLFVIGAWWASTGFVLYLIGRSRGRPTPLMLGATGIAALSVLGLWLVSADATVSGAFLAFAFALALWAWAEVSFLTGAVTGSRRTACPSGISEWRRFVFATQTLIYHELAILALLALVYCVTADAPNDVGLWTFAILWAARLSAKLNIFLGVANLTEEFLPDHLAYLKSYFRTRPMNALFPLSITVSTALTAALTLAALDAGASPFEHAAALLLATLMALVVVEHWFLVLPLPVTALWSWGLAPETKGTTRAVAIEPAIGDDNILPFDPGRYRAAGNA